jgi:hypothetical protein
VVEQFNEPEHKCLACGRNCELGSAPFRACACPQVEDVACIFPEGHPRGECNVRTFDRQRLTRSEALCMLYAEGSSNHRRMDRRHRQVMLDSGLAHDSRIVDDVSGPLQLMSCNRYRPLSTRNIVAEYGSRDCARDSTFTQNVIQSKNDAKHNATRGAPMQKQSENTATAGQRAGLI